MPTLQLLRVLLQGLNLHPLYDCIFVAMGRVMCDATKAQEHTQQDF
jgi:hypothetical protein